MTPRPVSAEEKILQQGLNIAGFNEDETKYICDTKNTTDFTTLMLFYNQDAIEKYFLNKKIFPLRNVLFCSKNLRDLQMITTA